MAFPWLSWQVAASVYAPKDVGTKQTSLGAARFQKLVETPCRLQVQPVSRTAWKQLAMLMSMLPPAGEMTTAVADDAVDDGAVIAVEVPPQPTDRPRITIANQRPHDTSGRRPTVNAGRRITI